MNVIKLAIGWVGGFLLIGTLFLIKKPLDTELFIMFGFIGSFIGSGVSAQCFTTIGYKTAKIFMSIVAVTSAAGILVFIDINPVYSLLFSVLGYYFTDVIEIIWKSQ